jgi:hypothetical protein
MLRHGSVTAKCNLRCRARSIARATRFVKSLLAQRTAQRVGAVAIVDDDRAHQHVVQ